jgi:UDP-GlcNAc:undecaprenyl-phosphate/decaprenyl-phosphate GlcNAc-1-phosphate transferase
VPEAGIAVAMFAAFFAAWAGSLALAGQRFRTSTIVMDEAGGSLRKIHANATPRIGGIAVAAGIFAGAMADMAITGRSSPWLLLLCVAPGFVWGLIEDLSKRGAVFARLALTGVVPALGFILFDARITELGIPLVDRALAVPVISFLFTVFAVTGVTHSMNVIDGLNGLSGVTALLASIGLAIVAWSVGDLFLATFAFVLAASALGFLLVNYPSGRIFLGDGGAYLFGLLLAELSVLLVQRNSERCAATPPVMRMRCTCIRSSIAAWCGGGASTHPPRTARRAIRSRRCASGAFPRAACWWPLRSGTTPRCCKARPWPSWCCIRSFTGSWCISGCRAGW